MKRFSILVFMLLLLVSTVYSETYYISAKGNDNNSGLSPNAPWKTIRKALDGNRYLLKRGELFSIIINRLYPNEKLHPNKREKIVIDAYGIGNKPVIDLYRKITDGWVSVGENVWKYNLAGENGRNKEEANIGFLNINNKIYGARKMRLDGLGNTWDFYCDDRAIYVYSPISPNNQLIKLARNYTAITLSNDMDISNIKIIGTGGHAIQGVGIENVHIKNVEIAEIGGSYLEGHTDGTRYGNGIEFYEGARNCSVRNSSISEVYDVAFTCQGYKDNMLFQRVIFENNKCFNNEQTFEFWAGGKNASFLNCLFVNNQCFDAGYGWSHNVRPDQDVGVHILNYSFNFDKCDLIIKSNVFKNARNGYMFSGLNTTDTKGFRSLQNKIFLEEAKPLIYKRNGKALINRADLIQATGLESASQVIRRKK